MRKGLSSSMPSLFVMKSAVALIAGVFLYASLAVPACAWEGNERAHTSSLGEGSAAWTMRPPDILTWPVPDRWGRLCLSLSGGIPGMFDDQVGKSTYPAETKTLTYKDVFGGGELAKNTAVLDLDAGVHVSSSLSFSLGAFLCFRAASAKYEHTYLFDATRQLNSFDDFLSTLFYLGFWMRFPLSSPLGEWMSISEPVRPRGFVPFLRAGIGLSLVCALSFETNPAPYERHEILDRTVNPGAYVAGGFTVWVDFLFWIIEVGLVYYGVPESSLAGSESEAFKHYFFSTGLGFSFG